MSKQRLGDRFSGTRYIAVIKADGEYGVSGTAILEDDAIWDAACAAGWPWQKGMEFGILIRLTLSTYGSIVQDGTCEITPEDIDQIERDILEDSDE